MQHGTSPDHWLFSMQVRILSPNRSTWPWSHSYMASLPFLSSWKITVPFMGFWRTPHLISFDNKERKKNLLWNGYIFDTVYIKCVIKCSSYLLDTYHNMLVVCCSIFDSVDIDVYSTLSVHSRYYRCRWLPRILSFHWSLLWLHWREVSASGTSQLREKVMMELDTLVNILTCINYICVRMEKGQI